MSNLFMGVSFGFGKLRGRVFRNIEMLNRDVSGTACGLQLDAPPAMEDIKKYEDSNLVDFLLIPEISPYSHHAIKYWDVRLPVMAIDFSETRSMSVDVFIDFDEGYLSLENTRLQEDANLGIEKRRTISEISKVREMSVLTEISGKRHLDEVEGDPSLNLGVLKGEFLLKDKFSAAQVALLAQSRDQRPVIRFPDEYHYDEETSEFRFEPNGSHRGLQSRLKSDAIRNFVDQVLELGFYEPIILFPMISKSSQILAAKKELFGLSVDVGASIETPAAVMNISSILPSVSFIEFGVNDLSQYTMGCSREVPIPELLPFNSIPEEVLVQLSRCVTQCHTENVEYSVGLDYRPNVSLLWQLLRSDIRSISSGPTLARKWRQYLLDIS